MKRWYTLCVVLSICDINLQYWIEKRMDDSFIYKVMDGI